MSRRLGARRPDAVYGCDLAAVGLDDRLVDACAAASRSGLHLVLAGFADAAVAVDRLPPAQSARLVVADPHRAVVARDGRWVTAWRAASAEPFESWLRAHLWRRGIGPMLVVAARRDRGPRPPSWVAHDAYVRLGSAAAPTLADLVEDLVDERSNGALPGVDESPGWCLALGPGDQPAPVAATLLALSSGRLGLRGDLEDGSDADHFVLASGAYGRGSDGLLRPLPGPATTLLDDAVRSPPPCRRVLDLHTGVLAREPIGDGLRTMRFVSLGRPQIVAMRAEDARPERPWPAPLAAPTVTTGPAAEFEYSPCPPVGIVRATSGDAVVTAHASQRAWDRPGHRRVERIVAVGTSPESDAHGAGTPLADAGAAGFDVLLDEHRQAWARRWAGADIEIVGDPDAQLAIRFALFHLLSCAPTAGEAAIGARGLTGLAYAGHVFWDTDVFVVPVLAATVPAAARAALTYRINRLGAARENAAGRGLSGARFPWESADSGHDVTPTAARDVEGHIVPIRTGEHEEHINADVAWALHHYLDWTGDADIMADGGNDVVLETARYWRDRVRLDTAGRGHLYGVIGPDEYHEIVDDNAFTNNLVRWHLRWAASLARASGNTEEAAAMDASAGSLVDGYDALRGCHEQFAGFWDLEPLLIGEIADTPVAADVLLGRDRVRQTQVIKQPDVLMLHHLLPDCCAPGSHRADLDVYLPRTAHGSSLSPAICAAQLARAGRPDDAMALFDIAARLDLGDLTHMAAGGLHLATMGGLWQAVVFGFAGIRPTDEGLAVDPHLPRRWERLSIRVRYRDQPLRIVVDHNTIEAISDTAVPLIVAGEPARAPARLTYSRQRQEAR